MDNQNMNNDNLNYNTEPESNETTPVNRYAQPDFTFYNGNSYQRNGESTNQNQNHYNQNNYNGYNDYSYINVWRKSRTVDVFT